MEIFSVCPLCNGTAGDGNPETGNACAGCEGTGKISMNLVIPVLDDLKNKVNDIKQKVDEIMEKLNE